MHVLVEVSVDGPAAHVESISDRLWSFGAVGVEERPSAVIGAFDEPRSAAQAADALDGRLRSVSDATGLDAWREHARAVTAGPFTVRPPWLEPGPGIDLVIDPGHTFGSGSHPSTRLALELLAEAVRPDTSVLDLGAGSGVLAIAAARLGANVTALDLDPAAETTIAANAAHNGVADRIDVIIGDISDTDAAADLVLLNVTIDIHEHVGPALRTLDLGPMIVAGLLAGPQEARCAAAHARRVTARAVDGEWAALLLDHGAATAPS